MTGPLLLPDRGVLAVTGPDTTRLLQDLVTNDLSKAVPGTPIYTALLTAQGKYLFDFILWPVEDGFLFDMDKAAIAPLIKKLTLYRLRAQVAFEDRSDTLMVEIGGDGAPDPRHADLPQRRVVEAGPPGDPAPYHECRIRLGVPETGDFTSDGTFWLETGAERLNGVNFKKGCYVGQEQTARMKHRGTVKKGYRPFRVTQGAASVGDEIEGARALGPVTSVAGDVALGFVRLGPFADSKSFNTENATLEPLPLDTGGLP